MKIKLYACGNNRYTLGLGYLKSNCEGEDVQIQLAHSERELVDCDLIGLSAMACSLREAISIMKRSKIPVVIGGHGTLWMPLKNYAFRHIVVGEGEIAFSKIINGLTDRIVNEPNLQDLDSLNFPYRETDTKIIQAITSRGCNLACRFCASRKFWKKARFHSARYFVEDIERAIVDNPKADTLKLTDDLFILDLERLKQIHSLWITKKLNQKLKIINVSIVPQLFNMDVAKILKEMNATNIGMGIETFSPRLQKILNKFITEEDAQKTIDTARMAGLEIFCHFIYDVPTETLVDLLPSIKFAKKNRDVFFNWFKFTAFPGADLYDGASPLDKKMKFFDSPKDWRSVQQSML